jgi:hypothetical protein
MTVAMIRATKLRRSKGGDLLLHFRKVDSFTKRSSGSTYVSSPLVAIEPVQDAHGTLHEGDEACMVLRTQAGSVYMTVLNKSLANKIQRAINGKTK